MYVARFVRKGIFLNASLFEKNWSEAMQSHEVKIIKTKKFVFRFTATHWMNRELSRILFKQHKLEIIDG